MTRLGVKQALTDTTRKPNAGQKAQNQNTEKTGSTEGLKLVDTAKAKLKASRFRYLNELLYTQEGSKSLQMFKDDPEAFFMYHEGYADQVWSLPHDIFILFYFSIKDYIGLRNLALVDATKSFVTRVG